MVVSTNIEANSLRFSEEQLQRAAIQMGQKATQSVSFLHFLTLREILKNQALVPPLPLAATSE